MQKYDQITYGNHPFLLQLSQAGPKSVFFKACLDCVTMAGVLFCAVLATLIIGL